MVSDLSGLDEVRPPQPSPAADWVSQVKDADGARRVVTSAALTNCQRHAAKSHRPLQIAAASLVLAVLTVEAIVIEPHLKGSFHALSHPRWWWLGLALASEIGSMIYFARVQRRMLTAGGVQLAFRRAVAVTFAANAMSVTLPAGPVISTAYTFRRMRAWGASSTVVTWGMLASGFLSTVALTVIGAF
ncbi:MAG: rane protein, partial [Frankiales bacterium]|nr:rane protein [Frankiales bacterium]